MRIACALFALGFVASQPTLAQDLPGRGEHIDSLIAASSASSFGYSLQSLSAEVALAQERTPAMPSRQALRALCERSFPPDSMAPHLRRAFEGRYNPAQFDLVIAWFGSPLGRKVVDAERSAAVLRGDRRQDLREKVRSQWVSSRRLLLLQRLDGNLGLISHHQTFALLLLEDLIAPPPRANATDGRPSDAQVQRMLLEATDRLESRLPDSLLFEMRVTYRSLSNDEMQSYNEFLESSGGRWYVEMLQQGLESAFLSGRERFVEEAAAMSASSRKALYP